MIFYTNLFVPRNKETKDKKVLSFETGSKLPQLPQTRPASASQETGTTGMTTTTPGFILQFLRSW